MGFDIFIDEIDFAKAPLLVCGNQAYMNLSRIFNSEAKAVLLLFIFNPLT